MTSYEIQKMSAPELNARIAESVGWKWFGRSHEHESVCWLLPPDWLERPGRGPAALDIERERPAFKTERQWAFAAHKVSQYTASLDDCHKAEEWLKEMGLEEQFAFRLLRSPGGLATLDVESERLMLTGNEIWQIAHANARQRAEAILMAVQVA